MANPGVTQVHVSANVQQPIKAVAHQLSIVAPPPVTVNGCTLPGPPVVVTIGPFQFNILDWQRAGKSDAKSMTFTGGIDAPVVQYLSNIYADVSKKAFRNAATYNSQRVAQNLGALVKFDLSARTLKMFQSTGGWASFSKEYKSWNSGWDLPGGDMLTSLSRINQNHDLFWIWRELIDGKAPIAKVDPPFSDTGHKWGLFVRWNDRKVGGRDEVTVTLKQLSQSWLAKIEYEIAHALSVGLEYLCKALTWDKLQNVRNFGTLFPNPTVQASVLAWQGVAQACGTSVPAQASGPPTECTPTPPPGLTIPWWKRYQAWLIGGGLLAVGLGGVAYYHSRSAR